MVDKSGADNAGDKAAILVVDDLPDKLLVFRTVLEPLGQDLVLVRSGAEALRQVLDRDFAVILLDVNMPDIDGFETASLIRKYRRSAHTPIIFVTAYADEMQTALGYSLGAVDYILSPVVPEILSSKVKFFVELFQMQRHMRRQAEERIALASAQANTRRAAFLADASRRLGGSLDAGVAGRLLLELLVPEAAPSAALLMRDGGSEVATLALERKAEGGFFETRELPPAALAGPIRDGLLHALDTQRPVELFGSDAGGRAGVALPLLAGERLLGAVLVAGDEPTSLWTALPDLADRAAMAFENARLYASLQSEIEERRLAQDELQKASRRKDEFLAMLSHELRNPLAPIRTAVELIRRTTPADSKLAFANEVMGRQVGQLARLVEELLDVARISQGKIVLQLEPVDLVAVIQHGLETARPLIEARHHRLTQHLPAGAVWLRGDFARLSQVVANLLGNAAKYTEEGGAIQVALGVENGEAVITVRDNGIGIDAELLPQVFELFEQGQRTLDRAQGGLGVGLTLVKRLVELHQGRVQAASNGPGTGAEFRVSLPCLVEVAADSSAAAAEPAPAAAAAGRVLVVDDNVDAAESIGVYLAMLGHEVKTAHDGLHALACAPVYAPDVVVLDIGLPGADGYEVARGLRRLPQTRDALLIALTGYGAAADRQQAAAAGFDRHVVKPADPRSLGELIAGWLVQRAAGRQSNSSTPASTTDTAAHS